jgi:hypothetical protein
MLLDTLLFASIDTILMGEVSQGQRNFDFFGEHEPLLAEL